MAVSSRQKGGQPGKGREVNDQPIRHTLTGGLPLSAQLLSASMAIVYGRQCRDCSIQPIVLIKQYRDDSIQPTV